MPWTQITTQDVLDEFANSERLSITGSTAPDSLANILDKACKSFRGAILAGGGRIGAEGAVPDQIVPDVIAYAKWRWLSALPMLEQYKTKDRQDLYKAAEDLRRDIAAGKVKVELPDDQDVQTVASPVNQIEMASRQERTTARTEGGRTRSRLDGLI
jgi:hypothetical protein